jgi:hypothetical protein
MGALGRERPLILVMFESAYSKHSVVVRVTVTVTILPMIESGKFETECQL